MRFFGSIQTYQEIPRKVLTTEEICSTMNIRTLNQTCGIAGSFI